MQAPENNGSTKRPAAAARRVVYDLLARIQADWGPDQFFWQSRAAMTGIGSAPRTATLAAGICRRLGIERLYDHQREALAVIERGENLVLATATASGKSLVYMLDLIERIAVRPQARGLLVYPLKALAQDQLRAWQRLAAAGGMDGAGAAIYDGDLSAWRRRRVREAPPNLVLTNPEMLHLSFLLDSPKFYRLQAASGIQSSPCVRIVVA